MLELMDWQNISRAPKDGTPLLMFSPWEEGGNVEGGLVWVSGGWNDTFQR